MGTAELTTCVTVSDRIGRYFILVRNGTCLGTMLNQFNYGGMPVSSSSTLSFCPSSLAEEGHITAFTIFALDRLETLECVASICDAKAEQGPTEKLVKWASRVSVKASGGGGGLASVRPQTVRWSAGAGLFLLSECHKNGGATRKERISITVS